MDPIRQDAGRLMIESVAASDLAARFGTPLYVTSEAALRANVRAWRTALDEAWPHGPTRVLVSLKANPTIALRRILDDEGAGCDVFGAYELEIALDAGTPAELISVNGSTKPEALIVRAIAAGARLTVDSVEELAAAAAAARRLERRAHVRLRLRPDLTDLETTSEFTERDPLGAVADAYKPGIPIDGLREALGRLDLEGVDLAGVHAHLGRHTSAVEPFRLHAQRLGALVGELARAMPGWTPREIDLGGGYSYPGDPTGRALRRGAGTHPQPRRVRRRGRGRPGRGAAGLRRRPQGHRARDRARPGRLRQRRGASVDRAEREAPGCTGAARVGRLRQLRGAAERHRLGAQPLGAGLRRPGDGRRIRRWTWSASAAASTRSRPARGCRTGSPPAT